MNNKTEVSIQTTNRAHLYFASFIVNLLFFSSCISYVWTSPTLIFLTSPQSHIHITQYEGSWVASLITLGAMFGAPMTRVFLDYLGRKGTLQLCVVLVIISWIMLAVASCVVELYAARFIAGIATGLSFSAAPLYIAEISDDSVRGALNTIPSLSRSLGYFFMYCVGPYLSYYQLILVSIVFPFICLFLFSFTPESPYHLVAKCDLQRAAEALNWLRGGIPPNTLDKELSVIQESINKSNSQKKSYKDLLSTVGNVRAMYLCSGFLAFQQFSGITAILLYAEPIFRMANTTISSSLSAVLIGGVMVVSACLGPTLTKRFGFIKPVLISSTGLAMFLGTLGLYFFLADNGYDVAQLYWLPLTSLFLHCFSYCLGIGSVPWAIMGEIFPPNVKSLAAGTLTSFNFFLAFMIAILFPLMMSTLGRCVTFWIYSGVCLMAIPFTIFLLPDTRGMSLEEIQTTINAPRVYQKSTEGECVV